MTQEIAGHSPVADIGCGVGVPLLPVGPTVMDRLDVIAGDISLRQLQSIREGESGPRRNLLQLDATRLPFRSACFGAAVARHMLYHVRDPRLAAAEAARVIRDDGLFVATTNSSSSRPELQNAHTKAVADLGGRLVERMSTNFDAESGGRKLSASFLEVRAEPWSGVLAFPTVGAVLDYYRNTAYFKMAFDAGADRSRLAGRVSEILGSRFGDGPAPLTVGGAIFVCTGPIRRDQ
ncbi:MAG: class I SAM-dependent methyltransferase [Acidimicrobiaceae bacterium]|nr:class I SAM-dependent methyltransferase [Acidimicrobiaceae bacterium]MDE0657534.1 class I SAM-dependent methyltransferase [Acidimicrobiaceae bacterium]